MQRRLVRAWRLTMCAPIALAALGGLFAAKLLAPKAPAALAIPDQPDPAAEKAKADAAAANAANVLAANDKKARRTNVLALGGETDALGASQSAITNAGKTSVLGGGA